MTDFPNAVAWAKAGHGDGQLGHCLLNVVDAFDAPHGVADAYHSWIAAGGSNGPNTHTNAGDPPVNVPIYWSGGSHGYGHIAISDGKGYCWSTDLPTHGKFTRVKISTIRAKWGLTYLGWSETMNGKRVHTHVVWDAKHKTWA